MLRSRLGAGSPAHLAGLPRGCVTLHGLLGAGRRRDVQEGCRRDAQVGRAGGVRGQDVPPPQPAHSGWHPAQSAALGIDKCLFWF